MTLFSRMLDLNVEDIDRLFAAGTVSGVLLDRNGTIACVSEGWRKSVDETGLALPNYGVGQSYLRHCAYAYVDQESARLVEGIAQLLAGNVDCLSLIYPCHSPTERRWFMMLGFPHVKDDLTALLHIEITSFMPKLSDKVEPVILTDKLGARSFASQLDHSIEPMIGEAPTVSSSARKTVEAAGALGTPEMRTASVPILSKRQQEVLDLMAKGMRNVDIGRALAISPNTVKIHVSGILARLGLPSRAQAIHWTLTRSLRDR